ncbi:MAG TPA: ABC transporter permease [Acidobacteriaceae bacterium]|nr:ABC transporter permease [Acidobacteriaceae bacterium]
MSTLRQDLHFALRQIVKRPGFATVVVLTLALGIGANTAVFSVLDAVLLRPLPYSQPQQLVKLWTRFTGIGLPNDQNNVSPPEFRDFQQLNHSFSDVAAISGGAFNIGGKGNPQRVVGAAVSPSLFTILGTQPQLGRTFLPEEAQPGRDNEVILSYGLWQRAFAGDPHIVGSTIPIDAVPMTVVGVMPAGFDYPEESEIWQPLAFAPSDLTPNMRGNHSLEVLARTRPGLSLTQVNEDMDRMSKTIIDQNRGYPYTNFGFKVLLHPLLDETVGDVKTSLWVLMAAVGLVLLIACVNVANLLLTRAAEREHEIGVRMALGASPWRLTRQLLTESVLLAFIGGLVGLAITPLLLRGLVVLAAKTLPRTVHTTVDFSALALTLLISLATGILFGLAPALQARRKENAEILRSGRNTEGGQSKRLRRALVMGETALSLILLAGSGLLLRSFSQVLKVDPGFRPDGVLTMRIALPDAKYSRPEQVRAFYSTLLDRIQASPGVKAAGAINLLPLGGQNSSGTTTIDTQSVPLRDRTPEVDMRRVTPDYFRAMGISLVRGRFFDQRDTDTSQPVAIIDETLAQTFWPGQDPIGQRVHQGGSTTAPWVTIVGVVRHVRSRTLEARSRTEVYWPLTQRPSNTMALTVLTTGNPMDLATTIQKEVSALDPELPVYRVRTMAEVMGESVARRRVALVLLAAFAGLALLLASVGIYGVTSYLANQRQREIGLRIALGSRRGQVLQLIIGQGMRTIVIGLLIGILPALALTRLMSGLLFGVRPADPLALGGSAAILLAVALVAIFIPARRASNVNPMVALRYE